ncbi:TPA: hypothetical protein U1359_001681 [Streptococcus suis]|nr:hypothetical protein [Streptococcus suis]HEM5099531.1 hypothetical protein [Streptococcus suis]HEM5109605.1 hypothetical protein [Streptococcus suis]HEM5114330.1 hypothetical protein [Streptococcus suis]HEO8615318.1 hypothetical protein [Streptococcus suis]
MIDKDRIISDQQRKIERIEKLQEELHAISIKVLGVPDKNGTLEEMMNIMHKLSHVIEDVLDGADPKKAIKENLTSFEEDNGEEE